MRTAGDQGGRIMKVEAVLLFPTVVNSDGGKSNAATNIPLSHRSVLSIHYNTDCIFSTTKIILS